MGKKKRLNRFITKWIKSDLPDDRSTVLLLGVTRIPTTPTAARRPCSLPLAPTTPYSPYPQTNPINQHKSRKNSFSARKGGLVRRNSSGSHHRERQNQNCSSAAGGSTHAQVSKPNKRVVFGSQNSSACLSSPDLDANSSCTTTSTSDKRFSASCSDDVTPSTVNSSDFTPGPIMDRSVDSIGACSLDADASVDITDWSEQSSVGTLRSISLPTPEPQPHLPSYLSLACTVSGYSTTTNYDPERLARSRDASPHRLYDDLNSATPQNRNTPLYTVRNNLLSPPNVVPLPHHKYTPDTPKSNMEEHLVARREFYSSSTRSTSYMSKESRSFVTSMFSSDSVDGCMQNGIQNGQNKCVTLETKSMSYITNGSGKSLAETSYKEFSNGLENKSFIQQRVERLYGPGALAQGFFISKRQKNRLSESESDKSTKSTAESDKHSKSLTDKLLNVSESESNLKQSTSSPTLPVLRHLRPEFRAQLIISPKKGVSESLPKSITVPILKEEAESKTNGHSKGSQKEELRVNGNQNVIAKDDVQSDDSTKDGHYFLKILDTEVKRLLVLADKVEQELETEGLSEEVTGKLRSASGKARLLASQKMQQFKGLCTNNITQPEGAAFPTTNEDLQGFWDMVLLQVEQVDALFKEIDALKANNWEEITPVDTVDKPNKVNGNASNKPRKIINRARPTSAANEEARKEREAKRKQMIEERRKAMREQTQQRKKENIEIYVPESS